MARFENKVALITGAAGGIGAATAETMVAQGGRVMLGDRDEAAVSALARRLGESARWKVCDVSEPDHMDGLISEAKNAFGRIDIGVLNAGIEGRIASIMDLELADLDRVWSINGRGLFIGLRSLMKAMRETGGSIVAVSSTGGLRGVSGLAPYVASKHAVMGLVRTAALEGAPFGIRVNAVNPGNTDTRMLSSISEQFVPSDPSSLLATMVSTTPLERMAAPSEIAAAIAFLASDDGSFCTGSGFVVDGGQTAGPYRKSHAAPTKN